MPDQNIDLIKITELPQGDAALQNPIMFGIGELVHTTPLSQVKELLIGGIESDIQNLNNGTKVTEVVRGWIGGTGNNLAQAAISINAGASFTIPPNHLGIVTFLSGNTQTQGGSLIRQSFLIKTGAATYGSGGTSLNSTNLKELAPVFSNIETVFNLGDIANVAIESFVNTSGPYIVQDVAIFTATQNDIEKEWLFIGGSGAWGVGTQQTNAAMFVDLAEQEPVPFEQIPPVHITRDTLAELLQDMNAGNLIKDFIYRAKNEEIQYYHFKGLSDPPFSGDLVPIAPPSGGQVDSVVAGTGIEVDNSDPVNPVISLANSEWLSTLNIITFDKNKTVGGDGANINAVPVTGALTLNLTGAVQGNVVTLYYSHTSLPTFVTRWIGKTDENFVENETMLLTFHLFKLDGVNSIIHGIVNEI